MEGSRCEAEGPVQQTKTTNSTREESQDVGCDTQPGVAGFVSAGLEIYRGHYLILSTSAV